MPTEIEVSYQVVTPLFCSGSNPDSPELRLPSFKGVLRYWWRALAWSQYDGQLGRIQQKENALFGSAESGRSRVSMKLDRASKLSSVSIKEVLTVSPENKQPPVGEGARYLGYGVMEAFGSRKRKTQAGQLTRACLRAPIDFAVSMQSRTLDEEQLQSLTNALIALGTLGGMGAKSRKGYGSLVIRSLRVNGKEEYRAPQSIDELRKVIANLSSNRAVSAMPEYTALSKETRHVLISKSKQEPVELLDLIGCELIRFRSWGFRGKILGADAERNFEDDHDLMKQSVKERRKHPRRIAFGLPHNYGRYSDQQVGPYDKNLDRRGSPLFIHIHKCGDMPVAVLSFLPARFLPHGKSAISVGGKKVSQTPEDILYRPVHEFLDRLRDRTKHKERFTQVEEVPRA